MNQKKLILIIILALVAGIVIGGIGLSLIKSGDNTKTHDESEHEQGKQLYSCGMHPNVISDKPGNCPICGMKLTPVKGSAAAKTQTTEKKKGKILYWRAPMDPTYISDKPGKSPMGMDLVPVYEGEGGGTGEILIDAMTVQNMGVRTAPVQKRTLSRTIRTVGVIKYNEKKLYSVNAKISGWIEKLYADFAGLGVKKNQPLLEIYSPELVSAQEEYLLSLKNYQQLKDSPMADIRKNASTLLTASRNRLLNWDIPQQAIDDLEKRGKITKTMTLVAPADGVITQMKAREGAFVKAGTDLYHIADLSTVWVDVSVYEYEIPWIKLNMPAKMALSYLPEKTFFGKVTFIYPFLDQKTRNLKVRLEFPNAKLELKPDMYANIYIKAAADKKALVVPSEAVIRTGERDLVFIEREKGKFEPREVKLGLESEDGFVEIASGLFEGENVVTSGQFLLDSESKTQEVIKKMLEEKRQKQTPKMESGKSMKNMEKTTHETKQTSVSKAEEKKASFTKATTEPGAHSQETLALYTCPMHPDFVSDNPDQPCPECGMKLEKKKDISADTQLYTCTMHPEFVTDDPDARCSICEMKLVKKEK
ncbi:MAG: efflux RND transporter periplasmic adaptor subunit [Calditrichaeota bacterium]|nr:efflux RND transporter periplasmic adaptor subunit [Calditrichota bacterium]